MVEPGTAAALLGRVRRRRPARARSGPQLANPDGSDYPSARSVPSLGDAVGHAAARARSRPTTGSPALPPARRRPGRARATSTGSRAPRSGCAATRSTRSAAGTSATSCTSRTSTCAGGCGARLGDRVRARRHGRARASAASRARRPYRMLVEHHRAAYRFADKWWHGPRRLLLLPFAAVFLAARGARRRWRVARGPGRVEERAGDHRVTWTAPWPKPTQVQPRPDPLPSPPPEASRRARWCGPSSTVVIVVVGVAARRLQRSRPQERGGRAARDRRPLARATSASTSAASGSPNAPEFEHRADETGVRGRPPLARRRPHPHPPVRRATRPARTPPSAASSSTAAGSSRTRSFKLWDGQEHKNGEKCGTGADAKPAEIQWTVGHFGKPWTGKPQTGNPATTSPKNGDIVAHLPPAEGRRSSREPPTADERSTSIQRPRRPAGAGATGPTRRPARAPTTTGDDGVPARRPRRRRPPARRPPAPREGGRPRRRARAPGCAR